jgi:hypothetical protein
MRRQQMLDGGGDRLLAAIAVAAKDLLSVISH